MEKKPTTLEGVVRSPRFYALMRAPAFMLGAEGLAVLVRIGDNAEQFDKMEEVDGPTIDDAITAAALRISALDAMSEVRNGNA